MRRSALGWSLLLLALLALILVPFFLFETALLDLAERLLQTGRSQPATAVAVFVLMLADVVLPVPSSVVATASGMLMGLAAGCLRPPGLAMQAGALLGYVLGSSAGRFPSPFVLSARKGSIVPPGCSVAGVHGP